MSLTHNSQLTTSLITGVNGFVGKHLASHLALHHHSIIGTDIQKNSLCPDIRYFQADIREADLLSRIFEEVQPNEIYHLAAVSHLSQFNDNQYDSFQINLMGSVAILEAMKKECPSAVLLMVGSSKQYKNQDYPNYPNSVSEQSLLDPASFYGIAKCFSEIIGRRYALTYDLDIRYTRSFNHTGPGQSPQFVCSEWACQIATIANNKTDPQISVGNIDKAIDFTDVRDVVEAYRLIVEKGKKGEAYNVCSEKGIGLDFILNYLMAKSALPISIVKSPQKALIVEVQKEIIGDNRKIREHTGWSPKIPIEKTLDDLYNWWLQEMQKTTIDNKEGG